MIERLQEEPQLVAKCPNCGATYRYSEDDCYPIDGGVGFFCEDCGKEIIIKPMAQFKWPEMFWEFREGKGECKRPTDKEIQFMIDDVVKRLKESKELDNWTLTASGNVLVFGYKAEGGITVDVCFDYFEAEEFHD